MAVKPIPDGYSTVTPYLYFSDGAKAIEWYTKALGAIERVRMDGPGGSIGHAEIQIGDSMIMMADLPDKSPAKLGTNTCSFVLYVEDVDSAFKKAVDAGATITAPLEDKFYGDRMGTIEDPFGHHWHVSTHQEDVSPDEMARRAAAASKPS